MRRTMKRNYLSCGWLGGWVAGSIGTNANSASVEVEVEVEVEAELGNIREHKNTMDTNFTRDTG